MICCDYYVRQTKIIWHIKIGSTIKDPLCVGKGPLQRTQGCLANRSWTAMWFLSTQPDLTQRHIKEDHMFGNTVSQQQHGCREIPIVLYTHTHIYIYIHTYIYIYTHTHTHIYIYTHTHIYIYIRVRNKNSTVLFNSNIGSSRWMSSKFWGKITFNFELYYVKQTVMCKNGIKMLLGTLSLKKLTSDASH